MEATARGAREAGGHTVGITCALWSTPANFYIVEEVRTQTFGERLMTLIERGDAYIALPGGTGTLAELALAWEMMNKRTLSKTVGGQKPLLVMAPYWQPVIDCLQQEGQLNDGHPGWVAAAMDIVTLIKLRKRRWNICARISSAAIAHRRARQFLLQLACTHG